jgi:hypothetical protein
MHVMVGLLSFLLYLLMKSYNKPIFFQFYQLCKPILYMLEGLQLGVSLSLMARTVMANINMINNAVIMEEEEQQ